MEETVAHTTSTVLCPLWMIRFSYIRHVIMVDHTRISSTEDHMAVTQHKSTHNMHSAASEISSVINTRARE